MARRRRRDFVGLQPIGELLRAIPAVRAPSNVDLCPITAADWEAAVGSRIHARTRPIRLSRGVLTVLAASSTWAQELSLLSESIALQLQRRGQKVTSLRFRVGHVEPLERPPARVESLLVPPPVPLPAELRGTLAAVTDEALRDAIAEAAGQSLAWREPRATSARRGARGPRAAAQETAPPAQTGPSAPEAARRKP